MNDPKSQRRAAALGALLLFFGGLVLALVVAVDEFPRGLFALACVAVGALAAWYGALRRGPLRVVGLAVGALGFGGAIVLLLNHGPLEEVAVVAALVLSLVCARAAFIARVGSAARGRRRSGRCSSTTRSRAAARPSGSRSRTRRGRAGSSRSSSGRRGTSRRSCATAVAGGADGLAMAGGDGSQAIVAAIAAELGLPYACIPAGTRNHFALDLGVDRDDVVGALDAFVDGGERRVDLAEVNGRVFVNNVSLGLYAEAVAARGLPRGEATHAARHGARRTRTRRRRGSTCAGRDPAGTSTSSGAAILVSNNRYRLGRAVGSGTRPRIDDGLLGITVVGRAQRSRQRRPARRAPSGGSGPRRPSRSTPTSPCRPASTARR